MKQDIVLLLLTVLLVACGRSPDLTPAVSTDTAAPIVKATADDSEVDTVAEVVEETDASASGSASISPCDAFMEVLTTRCEGDTLYVESDGLPTTHNMMVGIVSWQQQVPLSIPIRDSATTIAN